MLEDKTDHVVADEVKASQQPSTSAETFYAPKFILYNISGTTNQTPTKNANYQNNNWIKTSSTTNFTTEWGFGGVLTSAQIWQMNRRKKCPNPLLGNNEAPFIPLSCSMFSTMSRTNSTSQIAFNNKEKRGIITRCPYFSNPLFEKLPTWQFFNNNNKQIIVEPSDAQRYLATPLVILIEDWNRNKENSIKKNTIVFKISHSSRCSVSEEESSYDFSHHTTEDEEASTSLSPPFSRSTSSILGGYSDADEEADKESGILTRSRYSSTSTIPLNYIEKSSESEVSINSSSNNIEEADISKKILKYKKEEDLAMLQSCLEDSSSSNYMEEIYDRKNIRRLSRGTRTRNATSNTLKFAKFIQSMLF